MNTKSALVKWVIYLMAILAVLLSCGFFVHTYLNTCRISLNDYDIISSDKIISRGNSAVENGKIISKISFGDFNGLAKNYAQSLRASEISGINYVLSDAGDKLYINALDNNKNEYSFVCDSNILPEGKQAVVSVTNIRLGSYKLPVLGKMFWTYLNLPETLKITTASDNDLLHLESIERLPDGGAALTFAYDDAALTNSMSQILGATDTKKIQYHTEKADVSKELIDIAKGGGINAEKARAVIKCFEERPFTFVELCYLLKEKGIRQLTEQYGANYYKYLSADKLVDISDNEIEAGLNDFHDKLSKALLEYLYENPDYTVKNGSIYINGNTLSADEVLTAKGIPNDLYNVKLIADSGAIVAKYMLADYEKDKLIVGTIGGGNQ